MTIKTELLLQSENNINKSDMQKRGAVRNLFGKPDQKELQRLVKQQEDENKSILNGLEIVSTIGYFENPKNQAAKRLYKPQPVQSDESDDEYFVPTLTTLNSNEGEASSSTASSAEDLSHQSSSSNSTTTEEDKNSFKIESRRINSLPRGQRTMKSKNPTRKRSKTKSQTNFFACLFSFSIRRLLPDHQKEKEMNCRQ